MCSIYLPVLAQLCKRESVLVTPRLSSPVLFSVESQRNEEALKRSERDCVLRERESAHLGA